MLKKHFGTRHVSRSALVCSKCGQRFSKLEAVQLHIRRSHVGRPECSECGFSFMSVRALSVHLSKAHHISSRPEPGRPS
ncbi:zinc finger protein 568-like [Pollicipes pollicipes]|uniref:zinc finger protein 568-like n=1 Tax=Pollicipes pollicipes TaxID=41117 RepID=UPI0018853996|nr:zinc finger protein 568-like [Pollicipes pollicipes]